MSEKEKQTPPAGQPALPGGSFPATRAGKPGTPEGKETQPPEPVKKSKRYLWIYIVALFSLSIAMILLSYGTQMRMQKELEQVNENLSVNLENASGALAKAEAAASLAAEQGKVISALHDEIDLLQEERESLEDQNAALQKELAAAQAQLEEQAKGAAAADALWRLTDAYRIKTYKEARAILQDIRDSGLYDAMDEEQKAQTDKIADLLD